MRHLIVCLFPLITLLGACSDDDDDDDDEPTPAETCAAACNAQLAGCVQTAESVRACSMTCQAGFTLVPACSAAYRAALHCIGAQPFLTCADESIILSVATASCTDELASYLTCAAESAVPACLDAPLGSSQCREAGLPPRARICAGEVPLGCELYEGTMRAGGVGTFCCP